jgi:glycosyltransferase involved in cell wall biosynthesis
MKILIVNSLYYPNSIGGAEESTQLLAEGFVKKGFKVIVVCIHPYNDQVNFYHGVKIYYLHHRNVYFRFKKKRFLDKILKPLNYLIDMYNPLIDKAFERILKIETPDIIHTNNIYGFSPIIWNRVERLKIPLVHTLRDYQLMCARGTMFKKYKSCKGQCLECKILTITRRNFSHFISTVVGISSYVLKKHLEFGLFKKASKKLVIHNPLFTEANLVSFPKKQMNHPIRFLYLGGVFEHKGFYLLMKVFSKLKKLNNKWELWIAGRGEFKEIAHPNVKFLNFINPKDIYGKADVAIIPSIWNEPFGRIIIEANSFGLPVIGSCRGGIPELILHGKTGFVFDPNDEDDFLKYIKMFIDNSNLVLELSPNCLKYCEEFKIDKILDDYIRLYKSVVIESV